MWVSAMPIETPLNASTLMSFARAGRSTSTVRENRAPSVPESVRSRLGVTGMPLTNTA